jgi:hypothetical protein
VFLGGLSADIMTNQEMNGMICDIYIAVSNEVEVITI